MEVNFSLSMLGCQYNSLFLLKQNQSNEGIIAIKWVGAEDLGI